MIRTSLLAALCTAATATVACENIPHSQENCVRALACVGDQGLYFDGQATGWDEGLIQGQLSDGTQCGGNWDSRGPMNTGRAILQCDDGTDITVLYYTQDSETGTVTGAGEDTKGRKIRAWSGNRVLDFLRDGTNEPALPCAAGPIPLS